jgi:hypothetical protein
MAVIITLAIRVEAKEDDTTEGVHPWVATPEELASHAEDILGDVTKHDGQLGWRTTSVTVVGTEPA